MHTSMGRVNFTSCGERYMHSPESQHLQDRWGWNGSNRSTWLIPYNRSSQITTAGCKMICGNGTDYYDWSQSSGTITTWVLPIMGILLQAPFMSNAFWETIFLVGRWVGSPIASLAYILWNIKVSGKSALMADMAAPYGTLDDDAQRRSVYASMRDSLYLLMTVNQYSVDAELLRPKGTCLNFTKPAEGLLRAALFSKDLRLLRRKRIAHELEHLQPAQDPVQGLADELHILDHDELNTKCEPPDELNVIRQKLAQQLRETRRRGVVPVFISTLWFLFALAISIQSSFGDVGSNAVAHDLALGCLLAWLPILIMCSIVDRNPVSADDIRKKINRLVDHVRKSLMDAQIRADFINSIDDDGERANMRRRIEDVAAFCATVDNKPFFAKFAGQGRIRWHYGAAHPILCDIEDAYVAQAGRHWLRDERRARTFLVLGTRTGGLDWLDWREAWQVLAACICVCGTMFGAWILSYFTPTVGLGCRSGGYTVFMGAAVGLLIIEMGLWWWWDAKKSGLENIRRRATSAAEGARLGRWWATGHNMRDWLRKTCSTWAKSIIETLMPPPREGPSIEHSGGLRKALTGVTTQQRWEYCFFRPLECGNAVYLLYRTLSQTFGADNTCDCMSSLWAGHGGYIDFIQYNRAKPQYVNKYWITGTTISVTIMGVAMAYIVLEWCLQSHLSTADAKHAAKGLRRVRRFRRLTLPARYVLDRLDDVMHALEDLSVRKLKAWGLLSSAYEIRPIGLRWKKDEPPSSSAGMAVVGRDRADSRAPLMVVTGADGAAQSPERVYFGSAGHREERPSHESESGRRLLSPELPHYWRPTAYDRHRSSSVGSSQGSSEGSPWRMRNGV